MRRTVKSIERISEVFKCGRRVMARGVMAIYSTDGAPVGGRVAVIAGTRLGCAPVRNRAKRLIREALRECGAAWGGTDVLLVARAPLLQGGLGMAIDDIKRIDQKIPQQGAAGAARSNRVKSGSMAACGTACDAGAGRRRMRKDG